MISIYRYVLLQRASTAADYNHSPGGRIHNIVIWHGFFCDPGIIKGGFKVYSAVTIRVAWVSSVLTIIRKKNSQVSVPADFAVKHPTSSFGSINGQPRCTGSSSFRNRI